MRANTFTKYGEFAKAGYVRDNYGKRTAEQFSPQRLQKRSPNPYGGERRPSQSGSNKQFSMADPIGLQKPPRPIPSSFPQKNAGEIALLDMQPPSSTPPTAIGGLASAISKKQSAGFRKSETKSETEMKQDEIFDDEEEVPPVPSGPAPQAGNNGGGFLEEFDSAEERRRLESMNLEHVDMRDKYREERFPSISNNSVNTLSELETPSNYIERKYDKVDADGCQLAMCVIS